MPRLVILGEIPYIVDIVAGLAVDGKIHRLIGRHLIEVPEDLFVALLREVYLSLRAVIIKADVVILVDIAAFIMRYALCPYMEEAVVLIHGERSDAVRLEILCIGVISAVDDGAAVVRYHIVAEKHVAVDIGLGKHEIFDLCSSFKPIHGIAAGVDSDLDRFGVDTAYGNSACRDAENGQADQIGAR